jgi:hypothetical protein
LVLDPAPVSLAAIMTAARAGATDHAWALFERAGYARRDDDAAILAIKGRLLKDRGHYREAAQAYAAADAIVAQPYTRINTATLTLLAGDADAARAIAQGLIDWQDRDATIPETPYYLAATRAEALLLTGNSAGAETALDDALHCNHDGWDDHAITLRQLRMILNATGGDARWLDRFAPPRSAFFAGHLGVAARDTDALTAAVAKIIAGETIGFAYGALAAGADIVMAEAMLAAGAELHVVLPTGPDAFAAQSVTGYGEGWNDRYVRCLAAATSVRSVSAVAGRYEPLATQLAADVATGSAVLNAQRLQSKAVQLLVIDDGAGRYGDGLATEQIGERWAQTERTQHLIRWPRSAPVVASGLKTETEGRADRRLVAMLHIAIDGIDALDEAAFEAALDSKVIPLRSFAATLPVQPTLRTAHGNAIVVGFDNPAHAWAYARALLSYAAGKMPVRVAGHYGLAHWLDDPGALLGRNVTALVTLASVAMPGILTASGTLTTALFASASRDFHAELIGEIDAIDIYAMTARLKN